MSLPGDSPSFAKERSCHKAQTRSIPCRRGFVGASTKHAACGLHYAKSLSSVCTRVDSSGCPHSPNTKALHPKIRQNPRKKLTSIKSEADFLDSGGTTLTRLLDSKKAELLSWRAEEASRKHLDAEPAEVTRAVLDDAHKTPIIDILLKSKGEPIVRRRLALCEAPNRNQQLANQIERFLAASDAATPAILRTNGFPKGRTSQVAPALRVLEQLSGLKLDLGNTEWHNLARAKDFFDKTRNARGFSEWRRDKQWLLQWLAPLQPFIAFTPRCSILALSRCTHRETTVQTRRSRWRPTPTK